MRYDTAKTKRSTRQSTAGGQRRGSTTVISKEMDMGQNIGYISQNSSYILFSYNISQEVSDLTRLDPTRSLPVSQIKYHNRRDETPNMTIVAAVETTMLVPRAINALGPMALPVLDLACAPAD